MALNKFTVKTTTKDCDKLQVGFQVRGWVIGAPGRKQQTNLHEIYISWAYIQ